MASPASAKTLFFPFSFSFFFFFYSVPCLSCQGRVQGRSSSAGSCNEYHPRARLQRELDALSFFSPSLSPPRLPIIAHGAQREDELITELARIDFFLSSFHSGRAGGAGRDQLT